MVVKAKGAGVAASTNESDRPRPASDGAEWMVRSGRSRLRHRRSTSLFGIYVTVVNVVVVVSLWIIPSIL
jgi:hypothetical protein